MTKTDFELIAAVIRAYRADDTDELLDSMAKTFAEVLADTNARFDKGRFITASKIH